MSKNTRLVVLVVIATLVAFAGIGAFMVLQFGRTPPSSAVYGATIQASSYGCPSTYLGQYPSQAYWLILTAVLGNTGGLALTPGPLDWVVSDADGGHPAFATSQFYMTQTVLRGQSGNFTLAFDMTSSAVPSVLTLTLPNGNHPTALFSGCPPLSLGISLARSADGTNWTLTFTSVPSGLTTTGTRLTVITGGGSTALASTAFSALVYGTNKAAYVQAVVGTSVRVGDRVLISTTTYPTGYTYQISDGTSILASGTLQG